MENGPCPADADNEALKTQADFSAYIGTLTEDERVDLVTLAWLGCDTHTVADWPSLHAEARRTYPAQTAAYLLGTPKFADRLETGLSRYGISCATQYSEAPGGHAPPSALEKLPQIAL